MFLGRRFLTMNKFIVSLARFLALVASIGYLGYTAVMIYVAAPGAQTLSQDMSSLLLAVGLVLLALLIQRKDKRLGRFLDSI